MVPYILHYAPDNASLIIRLILEELGVPYSTRLVDRSKTQQRSAAFRAMNPVGRIPALETAHGPMFETAAIGLWLADRHRTTVSLAPAPDTPEQGAFLSWLSFLSNTVHAELRSMFYPDTIVGQNTQSQNELRNQTRKNLTRHLALLDAECARGVVIGNSQPTICDFYLAAIVRWAAIYPADADRNWFRLSDYPAISALAKRLEARPSAHVLIAAEGLGTKPFSSPKHPKPPEGSAL